MSREIILTENAPTPGNYSQAIKVSGPGCWILLSGQTGNLPPTKDNAESVVEGGAGPQTRQALINLEAVLKEAGASPSDIVRTRVYLTDLEVNWAACQKAYVDYFAHNGISKEKLPARSTIEARVPFPNENVVEIEADAFIPI